MKKNERTFKEKASRSMRKLMLGAMVCIPALIIPQMAALADTTGTVRYDVSELTLTVPEYYELEVPAFVEIPDDGTRVADLETKVKEICLQADHNLEIVITSSNRLSKLTDASGYGPDYQVKDDAGNVLADGDTLYSISAGGDEEVTKILTCVVPVANYAGTFTDTVTFTGNIVDAE